MNHNDRNVDDVLRHSLPSASEQQMDAALARVHARLQSDRGDVTVPPIAELPISVASAFLGRRSSQSGGGRRKAAARPARWALVVAGSLVIAAVGTAILWSPADKALFRIVEGHVRQGETIRSNGGGGAVLALTDGSRVEMRSHSELSLERADDGVRILLTRGSVIVNAAKQSAGRRLYVETRDVAVSVVGTAFLVRADQQGSRVAVIEGRVRVHSGTTTETLRPGEQVATTSLMAERPVIEEISWSRHAERHFAVLQQATIPPASATADPPDRFEVASIRPSPEPVGSGARGGGPGPGAPIALPCPTANPFEMDLLFQLDPGRLVMRRQSLYSLVALAYGHSCPVPDTITGGLAWMRSDRFDLEAAIPAGTPRYTKEQLFSGNAPGLQRMLQNMLADRFKLLLKREVKETQGYNLVVAEQGQLKLSGDQTPDQAPPGPGGAAISGRGPAIPSIAAPMSRLVSMLQRTMGRPILDKTGLTGLYDVVLEFPEVALPTAPPDGAAPSEIQARMGQMSSRIRDMLPAKLEATTGLRLEPARVPVQVLVIVSAERPTEN